MAKNIDEKTKKANEKKALMKAKLREKKAAAKAKKEAKRAALLEKKRAKALKKKERAAKMKAKKLALLEKAKAKKAALREKKRLAKEKAKALALSKKVKNIIKEKNAKVEVNSDVDIKTASKIMKRALNQIVNDMAILDDDARIKAAKKIRNLGYDVEKTDSEIIVRFDFTKSKKYKATKVVELKKAVMPIDDEKPADIVAPVIVVPDSEPMNDGSAETETVVEIPAGDLLGSDGKVSDEIATLDPEDEYHENESSDDDEYDDEHSGDSRDETDEDLIAAREEYFNNAADFGEDIES